MRRATHAETRAGLAGELIALLHHGAPAEELARRLAEVEAWPDDTPDKAALLDSARMAVGVHERLEQLQQRERGLLAIVETAQDLSSRLELTSLLRAIVSRARNLLGSDLAWLSVDDAAHGEYRVLVADGATTPDTAHMVARRDRGVGAILLATRLPFTTPDYLHDARFAHDPKLDDTFRAEGIAALSGVPMIWDGEVIGLLFVADRYPRMHTAHSLSILSTLAVHGAVALKNANDFRRAGDALAHAEQSRLELERHVRSIQAAAEAHAQMTSLLARGVSLQTLCQAMAELLGGATLVLDEAGLALSSGAAAGYDAAAAAEAPAARGGELARALRESRRTGRSVVAWEAGGECCRVMAVIGGDDVLGSAVLFHRGPLEESAVRTFERGSTVVGIVLLSQERLEASKSRGVSALLRSLVSPRQDAPALMADQAARHGVDLGQPLALLLVEMDRPGAGYAARRIRALTPLPAALVDEIDGVLVVVCAAARADEARQTLSGWARREPATVLRGVLSRPVSAVAEIPALYSTLRRALAVLGRIGIDGQVVGQNELAFYSTLFETHDRASLADFLEATIGPLLGHDRKRGSELAPTLLLYLDHGQNAKAAAQRLRIHVNTVRQRLATIEHLLGPWAGRALEIHVALRLWRLQSAAG